MKVSGLFEKSVWTLWGKSLDVFLKCIDILNQLSALFPDYP